MLIKQARKQALPELDSDWILLHVLGKQDRSWLLAHGDERLLNGQLEEFEGLVARRHAGEPLAYILGEWEFYGRKFEVTSDVLVPRPATEDLISQSLEACKHLKVKRVADVGTGSGVIAISLALEMPTIEIIATDISEKALEVARRNADRHGVLDRIKFAQSDMLDFLIEHEVDLIVSNPPYVPSQEARQLPDPLTALDGGQDGLDFVRELKKSPVPVILETLGGKIETYSPV